MRCGADDAVALWFLMPIHLLECMGKSGTLRCVNCGALVDE
jgi:hypothetical protein